MAQTKVTSNELDTTSGAIGGAWLSWTPTVTSGTGTITTASGTGKYMQVGKTVFYYASLTITTNGTGATNIRFTLPVTALNSAQISIGSGREGNVAGPTVAVVLGSSTSGNCFKYDNSYPGSSGAVLYISGVYEAA